MLGFFPWIYVATLNPLYECHLFEELILAILNFWLLKPADILHGALWRKRLSYMTRESKGYSLFTLLPHTEYYSDKQALEHRNYKIMMSREFPFIFAANIFAMEHFLPTCVKVLNYANIASKKWLLIIKQVSRLELEVAPSRNKKHYAR